LAKATADYADFRDWNYTYAAASLSVSPNKLISHFRGDTMKNRSSKTLLVIFALGLINCAFCVLEAAPITGTITIRGGAQLNTTSVNTATRVTGWLNGSGGPPTVVSRSGDFATFVAVGAPVTMTAPWTFGSGLANLWNVGGFTFNLTASHIVMQANGFLSISGTGTITRDNFNATLGTWRFTTQNPAANGIFSFSVSSTAKPTTPTPTP
jgi:hypothetical protein